ncbi:MAG: proline--tRNA ligase [Bdellovibrionales bacterium]|jgi:prolyl-tRNA synthetase|nr:proline--tRNA ligase [Bdellovibrionales bacterium]
MRWSKSHLFTLKDAPNDAEIPSHKLMVRAGLIKKVAPGIYTYGNLALRAIRKLERIIREELDKRGCQEVLMPMVQPAELWQETNRWKEMGDGLLKFKNRNGHDFCLGATHEEVITDYVRNDIKSYRDLPANLYQIQTKYRDEIRPRFGLMRGREFIMKDAYSFDADTATALKSYDLMYDAYKAIFERLGLNYRIVEADAGNIGGSQTHEFQLLADAGEDHLMVCDTCDFAANIEVAPALLGQGASGAKSEEALPLEAFPTPGLKSIGTLSKALGIPENQLVKTMFFSTNEGLDPADKNLKAVAVCLAGDDEVNPIKLKNVLGLANPPQLLTDEEVKAVTGAWPGSCGPVGLTIPVYFDVAIEGFKNFVVGANRDAEHLKNVNIGRDAKVVKFADVRMAKPGHACPRCQESGRAGVYRSFRGIEVGHVFYLGTKYSKAMGATYLNAEGAPVPLEMGCYGIGVSRTVQAAIEQSHDKDGIIWPHGIAPFDVHVVVLDPEDEEVRQSAEVLYRDLQVRGFDVLMDDRIERPGVKFKDADLLGMPVRVNIGGRGLKEGVVEVIERRSKAMEKIKAEDASDQIAAKVTAIRRAPQQGAQT